MAEFIPHDFPLRKLEAWRRYRKLTQAQLADAAGLSASMISLLENNLSDYSGDTLNRLSRALGCMPHNLMFDDPPAKVGELVEAIRSLTNEQRDHILGLVRTITKH